MSANILEDKKKLISVGGAVIILVVAGYIVINKFILPGGEEFIDTGASVTASRKFNPAKVNVKLNLELFDKEKYRNLKDNRVESADIEDLKVGKVNPFEKD